MVASEGSSATASSAVANCTVRAAEYDWSESDLGPQEQWAPAVGTVVRTLLDAKVPMAYCHGANYAIVYNDRFADVLGASHPRVWGQRPAVVVPEVWSRPELAELFDEVFAGGPCFHDDGEMLGRNGERPTGPGRPYFVRSCSAVRDSDGSVLGVVVVAAEVASAPVRVGEGAHADLRVAKWRGIEGWDQTVARLPLIWSGFQASARSSEAAAAETCPRFVAEGGGVLTLAINRPETAGSSSYLGMEPQRPDPPMVTLAAPYQPVSAGTVAGGDFYDGFTLPDGRIVVAIGQVKGCGVAAAVMEQVRAGLREAALADCDPNAVFAALDRLVSNLDLSRTATQADGQVCGYAGHAGCNGDLLVTALLGVFDPATGELLLANAGHFPPAVVHRRTAASAQADPGRLADFAQVEPGSPLGITGCRPVLRLVLEEGDALVAFTDGLLERHERDLTHEQATLLGALATMAATTPRSISQHVVDELNGGGDLEHGALLVVVRDSRVHHMASVLVPPQASAVQWARRWVRGQLKSWGLGEEIEAAAVLCVSELVTNVVLYAGTPARVSMELADRLLVTVEDTGTRGVPQPQPRVDRHASRGRGLALVAASSSAMGHSRRLRGSTVWFEIARDTVSRRTPDHAHPPQARTAGCRATGGAAASSSGSP